MQLPLLSGIYTDDAAQFRTSYPRNLIPVPKDSGLSAGYLRHTDGIVLLADTSAYGIDRGGINWNGVLYRALGSKLVSISETGTITLIGDIGTDGLPVTFKNSFNELGVVSAGGFWYYDGVTLTQNTDPDLGTPIDLTWINNYFAFTDGEYIYVSDLGNPGSINPTKYGSSEINPDPVVGVNYIRNELVAINRYTIEFFRDIGGTGFPFQRIEGAQIYKGCVGTHASCVVDDLLAFIGSGENEQNSFYLGFNGQLQKAATSEIDQILAEYTEAQLALAVCEHKIYNGHIHIMIHLADQTLVYDVSASRQVGIPIWYTMDSGTLTTAEYQARNHVYVYNKWHVADPTTARIGYLTDTISSHYGSPIEWNFSTQIVYNEGNGVVFNMLELIATTGRIPTGVDPKVSTSWTNDGLIWSQERYVSAGKTGQTNKRIAWFMQGSMRRWRVQRFKGTSDAMISIARLEAKLEPLNA